MTRSLLLALCVLFVSPMAVTEERRPKARPALRAVGYYIAVHANINGDWVDLFGASNLPPGAVLGVDISDYIGTGSKSMNVDTDVVVGKDGLFRAKVYPKSGESLHRNMVCMVEFQPTYPVQPENVLKVVGKTGKGLGDWWKNPQIEGNDRVSTLVAQTVVR